MSHRRPSLLMMMIIITVIVVVVSGVLSSPIAHYDQTKIEFFQKEWTNPQTKKRERCDFFLFCSEIFTEEETERLYKKRGERVEWSQYERRSKPSDLSKQFPFLFILNFQVIYFLMFVRFPFRRNNKRLSFSETESSFIFLHSSCFY